ncbi:MAG: hypothetical protein ACMUJM_24145 [bacterium]
MKKIFILLLLIFSLSIIGCEGCMKGCKHFKSETIGLKRRVTLYACDGTVIKTWEGRFMVELSGSTAAWIEDGKEVKIAGTFIIEEL